MAEGLLAGLGEAGQQFAKTKQAQAQSKLDLENLLKQTELLARADPLFDLRREKLIADIGVKQKKLRKGPGTTSSGGDVYKSRFGRRG